MTGFSCTCMKRKHICKSRESNLSILLSKKVPYPFSQSLSGTKVTSEWCETLKAPPCISHLSVNRLQLLMDRLGLQKIYCLQKIAVRKMDLSSWANLQHKPQLEAWWVNHAERCLINGFKVVQMVLLRLRSSKQFMTIHEFIVASFFTIGYRICDENRGIIWKQSRPNNVNNRIWVKEQK